MKYELVRIVIPEDLVFADLHLARDPTTGDVSFDWAPIERICEVSGLDIASFRDQPEGRVAELLTWWYAHHVASGGERDACADDLLAEVAAEDAVGGGISNPPGRA